MDGKKSNELVLKEANLERSLIKTIRQSGQSRQPQIHVILPVLSHSLSSQSRQPQICVILPVLSHSLSGQSRQPQIRVILPVLSHSLSGQSRQPQIYVILPVLSLTQWPVTAATNLCDPPSTLTHSVDSHGSHKSVSTRVFSFSALTRGLKRGC
ncbi:hypothetical protein PoB_004204900 [Plakobranchus ocellatus]|uniref:Uncharacterized protein n=1 Tax=Plakobranchus ocellatus TaxID=259542 RepID=A0AAV4B619_9GAST|nr:hypothetical protein PoB_004204900 [Plakobranchus ocellatus]